MDGVKLKVGQVWRDREGREWKVDMTACSGPFYSQYPFVGLGSNRCWREDGRYVDSSPENQSSYDLVELVRDVGEAPDQQPADAPKLTQADINAVIVSEHYFTAGQGDRAAVEDAAFSGGAFHASASRYTPHELDLVTVCVLLLRNGAKVAGVNHGPVSAANFDPLVGREMARKNAIDKVWELEGYLLRERMASMPEQAADGGPNPHYDPDADKGAKLLEIVRAFVVKHRIDCPEVIHQTDYVIVDGYSLIEDLCDAAGYYGDPAEGEEAQP